MKLLGTTEKKITEDKNGENHLVITEVVLIHSNMVNNDYQQDTRVLYKFVPNKLFGSLLEISPTNHMYSSKHPTRNIMKLKCGSQIKIVNH